jgi:hypothetical protein
LRRTPSTDVRLRAWWRQFFVLRRADQAVEQSPQGEDELTPDQKVDLDNAARLQQMKINTRLTALQTSLELMRTQGYGGEANRVDHITLLAMAGDIEAYVLGGLEEETKQAIENAKKPPLPKIIQVRP